MGGEITGEYVRRVFDSADRAWLRAESLAWVEAVERCRGPCQAHLQMMVANAAESGDVAAFQFLIIVCMLTLLLLSGDVSVAEGMGHWVSGATVLFERFFRGTGTPRQSALPMLENLLGALNCELRMSGF